ncbi:LigA [Nocardioidaceae bacterium Broad-1]|nr:LigA [Nocardioidaceae bacterium Broad-1]
MPTPRPTASQLWTAGLIANLITCAGVCAGYALSSPLYGTKDEVAHVDHAYQLWHGTLIAIGEPMRMPQIWGYTLPFDWTGQHPPLFYLLLAPVVGPLTDAGHLLAAGLAARGITLLITCLVVAAVMWTTRQIVPSRPEVALAAGLATALSPALTRLGGVVFNDNLFVLWVTLLVGQTVWLLRHGPRTRGVVLFGLYAAAALGTRLPGVVFIGLCATTLGLVWLFTGPRRDWAGVLRLGIAVLLAVAVNAWFYVRNFRATGNWSGMQTDLVGKPGGPLQEREVRSVLDVATDPDIWHQLLIPPALQEHVVIGAVLTIGPLVLGLVVGLRAFSRERREPVRVATGLLLLALTAVIVAIQLDYAAGGGGAYWRYLLPLTIVTSLLTALGLTATPRLAGPLAGVWAAATYAVFAAHIAPPNPSGGDLATAPVFQTAAWVAAGVAGVACAVGVATVLLVAVARSR